MRLALILSNDWELFGNGSGDFHELQERPLEILLDSVERFGAKLTLFAELGQQIWGARRAGAGCSNQRQIAEGWENSIRRAVVRGCDVQAHIHPQWFDATLDGQEWILGKHGWSFGELPPAMMADGLTQSKQYLERLLKPVNPTYECICFRAGAFYMQPAVNALRALRSAGFRADSSVVPGLREEQRFDYRKVPSDLIPWWLGDSLLSTDERSRDLLELPLYTRPGWDSPLLRKLISPRLFFKMFWGLDISADDETCMIRRNCELMRRYPLTQRTFLKSPRLLHAMFRRVLARTAIPLDYDQLPPALFVRFLSAAFKDHSKCKAEATIPIMAIGHSKGIVDGSNLERILEMVKREFGDRLCFWTVREAIDYWFSDLTQDVGKSKI